MIGLEAAIPSPTVAVWHLGPVPVRAYALCILVAILVAIAVGERRWRARGGRPGVVIDISVWAVPAGIIGGRLYHVVTTPEAYFGSLGDLRKVIQIWEGGLGIWGAVGVGALGAWIGCRRAGVLVPPMADALAPALLLAQAVGRLGNWFNNELYGRPTDLPWALEIHAWDTDAGRATLDAAGRPEVLGTYHPTFLYESLWTLTGALVLIWADRRFRLGHGRVFALYMMVYAVGRAWIEALRIDPAHQVLGLRLNLWTSAAVVLAGLAIFLISARWRPGREQQVHRDAQAERPSPDPDGAPESTAADTSP